MAALCSLDLASCVNTVGLGLDILGVVLLYFYGLPADVRRDGESLFLLEGKPNEYEVAKAKKYDRCARLGLLSLIVGFFLQILGNWVG